VRDGQSAETPVKTGRRREQRVEILEGLAAGDLVVVNSDEGQAGAVTAVREKGETEKAEDERRTAASHSSQLQNGSE
jgi:multidrug efflux pump subunit AcrA (membrane-fusion protein)